MAVCFVCAELIEPEREAWQASTCEGCCGSGCPVQWENGKPVERCDGCDCMPPEVEPPVEAGLAESAL